MTTPHRTLQMALDALEWLLANIRRNAPDLSGKAMGNADAAITALREALAAPETEPVGTVYTMEALVPGGDVRCHATLHKPLPAGTKLYAAPPAAPAPAAPVPDGWVMVPREPAPEMRKAAADAWIDCDSKLILNKAAAAIRAAIAASPAAPAAPVVPLTDEQIISIRREARGDGSAWSDSIAFARAIEAAHGITGGKP